MRRARLTKVVLVSAILAYALSWGPVKAASQASLVIDGEGNTYSVITIQRPVTVSVSRATSDKAGSYAGFAIYTADGPSFKAGTFILPSWEETGHPIGTLTYSYNTVRLRPGDYRVYLFGDAPTRVTVPIQGQPTGLLVRTRQPADVQADALDLAVLPAVDHADSRIPVEISGGSQAFVAATAVVEAHQGGYMQACVADPGAIDCLTGGDLPAVTAAFPSPGAVGEGYTMIWGSGHPTPGPMEVQLRMDGIAKANHLLGFYLIVNLAHL